MIVPTDETLFNCVNLDSEEPFWIKVNDISVDNVKNSRGGGLKAHNYWDNKEDFVKQFCDIVLAISNNHIAAAE